MNWKEIKERNPKAWELFLEQNPSLHYDRGYLNYVAVNRISLIYNSRDLYDFFDEQGIVINIFYNTFSDNRQAKFDYEVHYNDAYDENTEYYLTRKESETAAFEKAFEILEEKLNEEDNKTKQQLEVSGFITRCGECNEIETLVRPGKTQCDNPECKLNQQVMNRKRKYRVWNGKEMITDQDDIVLNYIEWGRDQIRAYAYDLKKELPLMDFIGLQDKNGKDIYEGDEMKIQLPMGGFWGNVKTEKTGLVKYESDYGGYIVEWEYSKNQHHVKIDCEIVSAGEVTGNIFEQSKEAK